MKPVIDVNRTCEHCSFNLEHYQKNHDYLNLGTVLNERYVLGKVLGHGGFGITYIAFDTKLNQTMAVKEYLPKALANRTQNGEVHTTVPKYENKFQHFMNRFLDEAKVLAKFNNEPGIVSVQDYFYENNTVYIVMHYIDGKPLDKYLKEYNGRLDYELAENFMIQVMESLKKVHAEGVIHRDISPDNIFISNDGTVKLLDFGAAREILEESQTLSIILKKGYAPLEQYSSKGNQGPWTDVYSVAATFYKLITGSSPAEPFDRLTDESLELPSKCGVKIPMHAEMAIIKALSIKVDHRYKSLDQFIYDLRDENNDTEYAETVISEENVISEPRRKKKKILIPLILVLVLFVFIIGTGISVVISDSKPLIGPGALPPDQLEWDENSTSISESSTITSNEVEETPVENIDEPSEQEIEENKVEDIEIIEYPAFQVDSDKIYASSYFVEVYSGGTVYNYPENTVDNDVKTGWCEDIKGHGIGEWIMFEGLELGEVNSISIINGYSKSEKLFDWNDRVKKALLEFSDGTNEIVEFQDGIITLQTVKFSDVHLTSSIKLTILEIYPGSKYADCCITEVRFNLED